MVDIDFGYTPQAKQKELHESVANEILFGGAAGPGKSHALRFEALIWAMRIPGIQVYLFRRTYPELEKNHILPSRELYPKGLGEYKSGDRRWQFNNGSMIHFCHCQHDSDVFNYQGAEIDLLCVARGTPILMAGGNYKSVEDIRVGDMAMTLHGPHRVTKEFPVRKAECVKVKTPYGEQTQPYHHKVLTPQGWVSYNDLISTQRRSERKSASQESGISCNPQPVVYTHNPDQGHGEEQWKLSRDHLKSGGSPAYQVDGQNGSEGCCDSHQDTQPPQELFFHATLVSPAVQSVSPWTVKPFQNGSSGHDCLYLDSERCRLLSDTFRQQLPPVPLLVAVPGQEPDVGISPSQSSLKREQKCSHGQTPGTQSRPLADALSLHESRHVDERAEGHAHGCSKPEDLTRSCSVCPSRYGGQPHPALITGPELLALLQGDAEERVCHAELRLDDPDNVPECIRSCQNTYSHPYTMEEHVSFLPMDVVSCSISPVGVYDVFDLTIDSQNHYITKSGLVNQNCIDELTTFTEFQYDYLRGRVRSTRAIPKEYQHKIPGIVCASNPGGVGHQFAKNRWVDFIGGAGTKRAEKRDGGMLREYIPALLSDNKILEERDPDYIHRLDALPEPYRTAYKEGDWDIFIGQAFSFTRMHHVIKPVPIPGYAPIYMTFDWGYGAPFALLWFWVDGDNRIYCCGEDYGWNGTPNQGLRLTDSQIAERIKEKEKSLGLSGRDIRRLSGKDCFNKKPDYMGGGQGPSTAEIFAQHGIPIAPGDPSRVLKIRQVHERLRLYDDMAPMLQVYDTCEHIIRTMPLLQADAAKPEDIDSSSEDHLYDCLALMAMARPLSMDNPMPRKSTLDKRLESLENPTASGDFETYAAQVSREAIGNLDGGMTDFGVEETYADESEWGYGDDGDLVEVIGC